jgi:ribosome biogenesis GTPase
MYFLDGGEVVIDTPGMREVGMADSAAGVASVFDELTRLGKQCRYADCTHANEPGCMVLAAIREGELDKDRYDNYISLKKEAEFYELSEQERREKDRSFGKFVKKAKKSLQKYD